MGSVAGCGPFDSKTPTLPRPRGGNPIRIETSFVGLETAPSLLLEVAGLLNPRPPPYPSPFQGEGTLLVPGSPPRMAGCPGLRRAPYTFGGRPRASRSERRPPRYGFDVPCRP
jgi:hypothetical protein